MGFTGRNYEGAYTSNIRKVGIKEALGRYLLKT
jgi:hypothetical protein